jgi:DNA-3-methyladenine glycosylase I
MNGRIHVGADGVPRCLWCGDDPLYQRYHDTEWGRRDRPLHGEDAIFEKIVLEGMQAGLSWITILRKREHFRAAFAGFAIERVAEFGPDDRARLLADAGIVRNRAKVDAAISNAVVARSLLDDGGSLDQLCWSFAPDQPWRPRPGDAAIEATTPESKALSKELLRRGFRFVGPTTMYAFMQSSGMVNDHIEGCAFAD